MADSRFSRPEVLAEAQLDTSPIRADSTHHAATTADIKAGLVPVPPGMLTDPAQTPRDLKVPVMEAGQPASDQALGLLLKSVLAAVHDGDERVNLRVDELATAFEGLKDKADFDRRVASLKAAREHITGLTEQKNSKGYADYKLGSTQQIEQELKVAAYLLGEQ